MQEAYGHNLNSVHVLASQLIICAFDFALPVFGHKEPSIATATKTVAVAIDGFL